MSSLPIPEDQVARIHQIRVDGQWTAIRDAQLSFDGEYLHCFGTDSGNLNAHYVYPVDRIMGWTLYDPELAGSVQSRDVTDHR